MIAVDKKQIGIQGEQNIYQKLIDHIDIYQKIIRNVYIPNQEKQKTEIDLMLITAVGIFVIESKNFKGWIFGNQQDKIWTQCLWNHQKYYFKNPIIQNNYHISFLTQFLHLEEHYFSSYIVFGEKAELKKITCEQEHTKIIQINDLISLVEEEMVKRDIILSHEEIDKIYMKLKTIHWSAPYQFEQKAKEISHPSISHTSKHKIKWNIMILLIMFVIIIILFLLNI